MRDKRQYIVGGVIGDFVSAIVTATLTTFVFTPSNREEYPVHLLEVCQGQGHAGVADESDNSNPYQWICYDEEPGDLAFPNAGLDIHAWCGQTYPGSRAEVVDDSTAYGWRCVVGH